MSTFETVKILKDNRGNNSEHCTPFTSPLQHAEIASTSMWHSREPYSVSLKIRIVHAIPPEFIAESCKPKECYPAFKWTLLPGARQNISLCFLLGAHCTTLVERIRARRGLGHHTVLNIALNCNLFIIKLLWNNHLTREYSSTKRVTETRDRNLITCQKFWSTERCW